MITKKKLFLRHASDFNFELNADQLLEKALECGFIKRASMGWGMKSRALFRYNPDYVPNVDKMRPDDEVIGS